MRTLFYSLLVFLVLGSFSFAIIIGYFVSLIAGACRAARDQRRRMLAETMDPVRAVDRGGRDHR